MRRPKTRFERNQAILTAERLKKLDRDVGKELIAERENKKKKK